MNMVLNRLIRVSWYIPSCFSREGFHGIHNTENRETLYYWKSGLQKVQM